MFPGSNNNTDLGYNKHNQYMAQPPHFLVTPGGPGTIPGPVHGPGIGNTLRTPAPGMPVNMQGPIDWAQLAQQWIHMRDSATASAPQIANFSLNMPIAPPPPIISNAPEYQHTEIRQHLPKKLSHYEEHGEAEMDMDLEDEESDNIGRAGQGLNSASLPRGSVVAQSPWLDSGVTDVPVTVANNETGGSSQQQWNNWSARGNPTAHIPSLLKLNVCNPNEPQQLPQTQPIQNNNGSASSEIDANKRKMLPAWIREGLEKMEREKQRQLERQQPTSPESEPPATSGNVKQVSSKSLTTPVNLLNITNVPSDSEDSSNAAPEEALRTTSVPQLLGNHDADADDDDDDVLGKATGSDDDEKSENDDDTKLQSQQLIAQRQPKDTIGRDNVDVARAANAEAALSGKNYEERLADLMLVVRRTLTEILLETTNEEIAAIATETLKAHRAKASSAQVIRKSALSSITGNLGLAAYGDSSSESGEEENNDDVNGGQVEHSVDSATKEARDKSDELSAEDLKVRIRKSKRAFERVIDDIEERVLLQEKLDEKKLQYHRKLEQEQLDAARQPSAKVNDSPVEETAPLAQSSANDKLQQFNSKRLSRKERTTRFSDNKDGKQCQSYVNQVVAAAAVQSSIVPQKLKPVPNPATNLLQMPEGMASMLSAADKALSKAHKSTKKSKSRRRQSSSSSSSSSSGDSSSSSSTSDSNSSSNSTKSSSNTDGSSTRSSHAAKKHGSRSHRQSKSSSSRARSETSRKGHRKGHTSSSSSRRNSERHHSSRTSRDRDRDRDHDRRAVHYSSRRRGRHRDSSNSADDDGSGDHKRSSRHSSSRSHQSSSYNKHRGRTRSRSKSRSTHNSYSSASTKHQNRKRH